MSHTAEIIAVGTELLLGNIANTNAQEISESLSTLGLSLIHISGPDPSSGNVGPLHPAGTASGRKSSAAIFATRRYLVLFLRPLLEYNKKAAMLGT